jgi:hypothetical protein
MSQSSGISNSKADQIGENFILFFRLENFIHLKIFRYSQEKNEDASNMLDINENFVAPGLWGPTFHQSYHSPIASTSIIKLEPQSHLLPNPEDFVCSICEVFVTCEPVSINTAKLAFRISSYTLMNWKSLSIHCRRWNS